MKQSKLLFCNYFLGFGFLIFSGILFSCDKSGDNQKKDTNPPKTIFYFGADLSSVNMVEDFGALYKDSSIVRDPFAIFKNHGCNLVRVRLFNNPDAKDGYSQYYKPGYCGLTDVAKTIQRAKNVGMEVCLDFHYSDTWADPANQKIPLAWKELSLNVLKDSLYNYTISVLNQLKEQNLTPEIVQLGNEIDPGILLPIGNTTSALAVLLNSGIKAVRNFSATSTVKPKIIIHYADNAGAVSRFEALTTAGVTDFDIIGISYYDQWTKINFAGLASVIKQLKSKFVRDVMVVETDYQWTNISRDGKVYTTQLQLNGFPVSKEGQYDYLKTLTQQIISAGGSGIIYWEPAWIKSSIGWGLEIQSMFDFDGNVLPGIDFMNYSYKYN